MSREAMKLALEALEAMTYAFRDTEGNQGSMEEAAHEVSKKAITKLRRALEQPAQQEPVAELLKQSRANFERNFGKGGQGWADWIYGDIAELLSEHTSPQPAPVQQEPAGEIGKVVMFGGDLKEVSWKNGKMPPVGSVLYTSPPAQRTWVGLTDEERMDVLLALNWDKQLTHMDTAKSIEAKLKEKNT